MTRNYAFAKLSPALYALALAASLVLPAQAQLGVTDCSCVPTTFQFKLKFSGTCPPAQMAAPPGIARKTCIISNLAQNPQGDRVPVSANRIQIFELGSDSRILAHRNLPGEYADESTVDYQSVTAETIDNPDRIPFALQIQINAENSLGEPLLNTWVIEYTNECNVAPVLSVGDVVGWTEFAALSAPKVELCPSAVVPTTSPGNALPASTSALPAPPTDSTTPPAPSLPEDTTTPPAPSLPEDTTTPPAPLPEETPTPPAPLPAPSLSPTTPPAPLPEDPTTPEEPEPMSFDYRFLKGTEMSFDYRSLKGTEMSYDYRFLEVEELEDLFEFGRSAARK